MLAAMASGHDVRTVEGLADGAKLDLVQEGFMQCHGLQCGFCTPGMMITARALLDENPTPPRTRSARPSPARSAGVPATPRSSDRSSGPPSMAMSLSGEEQRTQPRRCRRDDCGTAARGHRRQRQEALRLRPDAPQGGPAFHPRPRQLRRRRTAARHAAPGDPAVALRARDHQGHRHHRRPGPPEGQGRHHRRRPGREGSGVDADPVQRRPGRAGHRQGALPGSGGGVRRRRGPVLGARCPGAHRRRLRTARPGDRRAHRRWTHRRR